MEKVREKYQTYINNKQLDSAYSTLIKWQECEQWKVAPEEYNEMMYDCRQYLAAEAFEQGDYFACFCQLLLVPSNYIKDENYNLKNEVYYIIAMKYLERKNIPFADLILREIQNYKDASNYISMFEKEFYDVLNSQDLFLFIKRLNYSKPLGHFMWKHSVAAILQRLIKAMRYPGEIFTQKGTQSLRNLDSFVALHKSLSQKAEYMTKFENDVFNAIDVFIQNMKQDNGIQYTVKFIKKLMRSKYCTCRGESNWIGRKLQINLNELEVKKCAYEETNIYIQDLSEKIKNLSNIKYDSYDFSELKFLLNDCLVNENKEVIKELIGQFIEHMQLSIHSKNYLSTRYMARKFIKYFNDNEIIVQQFKQILEDCDAQLNNSSLRGYEKYLYLSDLADELIDFPNLEKCEFLQRQLERMAYAKELLPYGIPGFYNDSLLSILNYFWTTKWNGHNHNCLCETIGYKNVNSLGNTLMYKIASQYKKVIFFDIETTGLHPVCDKMIEFAYVVYEGFSVRSGKLVNELVEQGHFYVKLPHGRTLSNQIIELTHITDDQLQFNGIEEAEAKEKIKRLIIDNKDALFVAYNASFDLSFIFELLKEDAYLLYELNIFDLYFAIKYCVTKYKEEPITSYKLSSIIKTFHIPSANNSHNAIDDAQALYYVLREFEEYGYGRDFVGLINKSYYPENLNYTLPQIEYHKQK